VLIRAAIAGLRRNLSRQRLRHGPMLPTGMPSLALIWAYGTGGSSVSRAISRWQLGGSRVSASRSAACRSASSSSCSAIPVCSSGMASASGPYLAACAASRTLPHSRRVVVASQPGSAAGTRSLPRWPTRPSQTLWLTSWMSASLSRYLRQMDQTSGAYRSTRVSHACSSPCAAHVTRSVIDGSSLIGGRRCPWSRT
jgi:hypothetical protein